MTKLSSKVILFFGFVLCVPTLVSAQFRSSVENDVPPTILSLIVDGTDNAHLLNTLQKLEFVKKHRKVVVGEVYVYGATSFGGVKKSNKDSAAKATNNARDINREKLLNYLDNSDVGFAGLIESKRILKKVNVQNSPVWIVRYRGKDYIFEGFKDPRRLFNKRGEFLRGNS